jgi:hypothetical protein
MNDMAAQIDCGWFVFETVVICENLVCKQKTQAALHQEWVFQMGFSIRSLVVVTAAYVASFGLVNGLIAPVQNAVFPAVPSVQRLIF